MYKLFFASLYGIFHAVISFGITDTASNGNWSDQTTWTSSTSPASSDTLIIPYGASVTVDCNCGTYADMHIIVYGTLDFPGGRKINLTANGKIDVYSNGLITGSNDGDKIIIDGSTVWSGNDGPIVGPASCLLNSCGSNQTLPVELLYLNAGPKGRLIEISWATATETENDYFTIWRLDDHEQWYVLTQVPGSGNSQAVSHYSYEDAEAEPGHVYYYRLSQTDFDGGHKPVGGVLQTKLEPGLASLPYIRAGSHSNALGIFIPPGWSKTKVSIFDLACNMKAQTTVLPDAGHNGIELPALASGIYLVQFMATDGSVHYQRIAL